MIKFNRRPIKMLTGIVGTVIIVLGAALYTQYGKINTRGAPRIDRQPLDEPTLTQVRKLDRQNYHATFVFVNEVPGIAEMRNRVIILPPVGSELRIDFDQYIHKGHFGPLFIILPDNYAGPKEKFILKAFPNYRGWYGSMLSDKFVMYAAK
jgi:hypothetical protein